MRSPKKLSLRYLRNLESLPKETGNLTNLEHLELNELGEGGHITFCIHWQHDTPEKTRPEHCETVGESPRWNRESDQPGTFGADRCGDPITSRINVPLDKPKIGRSPLPYTFGSTAAKMLCAKLAKRRILDCQRVPLSLWLSIPAKPDIVCGELRHRGHTISLPQSDILVPILTLTVGTGKSPILPLR